MQQRSRARSHAQSLLRLTAPLALAAGLAACGGTDAPIDPPKDPEPTRFMVRVDNLSDQSGLPTPLAPGAFAIHGAAAAPIVGGAAATAGLQALAEDGSPGGLRDEWSGAPSVDSAGVFDTPEGASSPGPLLPGGSYVFMVEAEPGDRLFWASMLVQSNDLFFAPAPSGLALFDANGAPLADRDVTDEVMLWDAGSEADEPPGQGPNQAPRQAGPNQGQPEATVRPAHATARALPGADAIVEVLVSASGADFTFEVRNVSGDMGLVPTPIAPVFYATHDEAWSLFEAGAADRGLGLESLAEDGSPMALVQSHTGAAGTDVVGAQAEPSDTPGAPGPAFPGQSYRFTITANASHPYLTLAAMVVQSNDAFVAPPAGGVRLFDEAGAPRAAADVQADLRSHLAVWDAGTEANEAVGVGANQAPRQPAANTGAPDPNPMVRRYFDATVDLAGPNLGGFAEVRVSETSTAGTFALRVRNVSGDSAFPGVITPPVWALHDADGKLFELGATASEGLEALAEDGNAEALRAQWSAASGVAAAGIAGDAPLLPDDEITVDVTPSMAAPRLNLAAMIVPSNDTFLSLGPTGIALLDAAGAPRALVDIQADVDAALAAYDAGTEANQAGAAGKDQAPRQSGPNVGAGEGSGEVRVYDGAWPVPAVRELVRVQIRPVSP